MKTNVIYNKDCLVGMKELPDNSLDLLLTDSPYGISFMGKHWDRVIPSLALWKESLRVLKPGAFAFVMCIPRQDCLSRMIISLEDAGFNVSFSSIYWAYASGFPKASNIGKAVDKRRGCDVSKYIVASGKTDLEIASFCKISSALVRFWRKNERQIMYREWCKLKLLLDIKNKRFDEKLKEVEREIIGKGKSTLVHNNGMDGNFTGEINPKSYNETLPSTPQAKTLDGSYGGFQPKPTVEVILVAMKPLSEKTYVDQALKNRKGVTWLDDCRIPYKSNDDKNEQKAKNPHTIKADNAVYGDYSMCKEPWKQPQGRFSANLLCSDDVLNDGKDRKSGGNSRLIQRTGSKTNGIYGKYVDNKSHSEQPVSSGSFSRYFSLDAWWEGRLKGLPESVRRTFPFLIVPKASKAEKNRGCEGLEGKRFKGNKNRCHGTGEDYLSGGKWRKSPIVKNIHPTCKPLKLISYLITLGSRPGDLILDPFLGSGTTAIATKMLDRQYIGYEINKEYFEIAKARLAVVTTQLSLFKGT